MRAVFLVLITLLLIILSFNQSPEIHAQTQSGDDCDDLNSSINPGVNETGSLCSNLVDDDCDGKIDCEDPDCGGEWGPNVTSPKICCTQISDCNSLTTGTCGQHACNNNECTVEENTGLCNGQTTGQCGTADGTCTATSQGTYNSYDCNFMDDVSMCTCDESCSGSPNYQCETITTSGCALIHSQCLEAVNDTFKEPNDEDQCICHGLWEACG